MTNRPIRALILNSAQNHNLSDLTVGTDATTGYVQGGYLLPGKLGAGRIIKIVD